MSMAGSSLGIIGLGSLGSELGKRMVGASMRVAAFDLRRDVLLEGATIRAGSVGEVAAVAATVVSIVPNDVALRAVSAELLAAPLIGRANLPLHISCSTVSPHTSRELAASHAAAGWRFVAAPIFARPENMAAGQASFVLSGGDAAAREAAVVDALLCAAPRERCFDFGDDAGAANVVKLSGNFLIASAIEALAESLALAEANGVSRGAVLEMLTSTIFDCAIYKGYGGRIARRDHAPGGFNLELGLKDVDLALDTARRSGAALPLGSLLRDRFQSAANDADLSRLDWSALALLASRDCGVNVAPAIASSLRPTPAAK